MIATISTVLLALVLASASSASAECAWALWAAQEGSVKGGPYQGQSLSLMSAHTSAQDCIAKLDSLQTTGDQRWAPTTLDGYMEYPKAEITHVKWQCLPDTVDPRGPKGGGR